MLQYIHEVSFFDLYSFVCIGIAIVTVTEAVQEKGGVEDLVEVVQVVLAEEEDLEEVEEIVSRVNSQVKG